MQYLLRTPVLATAVVLGAVSARAYAVDVDIYGRAHVDFGYLDDGGDHSSFDLSSRSSRIGFRAGHELAPGLRVHAQIEGKVNLDSDESSSLTSRDSFVGLDTPWGLLRAGFLSTPNKSLRSNVSLFTDQLGDLRNVVRGNYLDAEGTRLQGFDERFRKSIAYRTPAWRGFTVDLHYSVETERNGSSADGNDNDAWSGSLSWRGKSLFAGIAHERNNKTDPELADRSVTRLAAYYDLAAFRFTALAQAASDPDDDAWGAGVRYTVHPRLRLKAEYYRLEADDSDFDADQVAVGADWLCADNLTVYFNLARLDNGTAQTLAPWRQASSIGRNGAAGETAQGAALGVIYNFP